MKLWIFGVALCLIRSGFSESCNANIESTIQLKPMDAEKYEFQVNEVQGIDLHKNGDANYVDVKEENNNWALILRRMDEYHKQAVSGDIPISLFISVDISCKDNSKITKNIEIKFIKANIYPPELKDTTSPITFDLPMPFPILDLALMKKIVIVDWDMYNTGIKMVGNIPNFNIQVHLSEENNLKRKEFVLSILPTVAISEETTFTINLQDTTTDAPSNSLPIEIIIMKNNEISTVAFKNPVYYGEYQIDADPRGFSLEALTDTKDMDYEIDGTNNECFDWSPNDDKSGMIITSTGTCNISPEVKYLSLKLIALKENKEVAYCDLVVKINGQHFDQTAYVGKFEEGKLSGLENINLFDAIADVKIQTTYTDVLDCNNNKDAKKIECTVANPNFNKHIYETEITAKGADVSRKVSARVVVNFVPQEVAPIVITFDKYKVAHTIAKQDVDKFQVEIKAKSSDGSEKIEYKFETDIAGKIKIDPNTGLVKIETGIDVGKHELFIIATGRISKSNVKTPLVLIITDEPSKLSFTQAHYLGKIQTDNKVVFEYGNPELSDFISQPSLELDKYEEFFKPIWEDNKITIKVIESPVEMKTAIFTLIAGKKAETTIVLNIEESVSDPSLKIKFEKELYSGKLEQNGDKSWNISIEIIKITTDQKNISLDIDNTNPNKNKFSIKRISDKEYALQLRTGQSFDGDFNVVSLILYAISSDQDGHTAVYLDVSRTNAKITFDSYQIVHTKKQTNIDDWPVVTMKAMSTILNDTLAYSIRQPYPKQIAINPASGEVKVQKGISAKTHEVTIIATGSTSKASAETPLVLNILKNDSSKVMFNRQLYKGHVDLNRKILFENENPKLINLKDEPILEVDDLMKDYFSAKWKDKQVDISTTTTPIPDDMNVAVFSLIAISGVERAETIIVFDIEHDESGSEPETEITFKEYDIAHTRKEDDNSKFIIEMEAISTNSKDKLIYGIKDEKCMINIRIADTGKVMVLSRDVGTHACIITAKGSTSNVTAEAPLVIVILRAKDKLLEFTQPSYVGKMKLDKTIVFQDGNPLLINWKEEPMFDLGPHSYYFRVKWDDGKIAMESTGQTIDENVPVVTFTLSATSAGIQADTIIVLEIEHNDNEQPDPAEQIEFSQITYEGIIKRNKEGEWIVTLNNGPIKIISGQTSITVAINPSDERFALKTVTPDEEYELVVNEDNFDDAVNVTSVVIIATSTNSNNNKNKGFSAVSLEIKKEEIPFTEIKFDKYQVAHVRKADDLTEWIIPMKATSSNTNDLINYNISKDNCVPGITVNSKNGEVTVKNRKIGIHECIITATGSVSKKTEEAPLVLIIISPETPKVAFTKSSYIGKVELDRSVSFDRPPELFNCNEEPKLNIEPVSSYFKSEWVNERVNIVTTEIKIPKDLKLEAFTLSATCGGFKADTSIVLTIEHDTSGQPDPEDTIKFSKTLYTGNIKRNNAGNWVVKLDDSLIEIKSKQTGIKVAIEPKDERFKLMQVVPKLYIISVIQNSIKDTENVISLTIKATAPGFDRKESKGIAAVSLEVLREVITVTEILFEKYQIAHTRKGDDLSDWIIPMKATSSNTNDIINYDVSKENCVPGITVNSKNGEVTVKNREIGTHECIITATGSVSKKTEEAPLILIILSPETPKLGFTKRTYSGKVELNQTITFKEVPTLINWKEEPKFTIEPPTSYFNIEWAKGQIYIVTTTTPIPKDINIVAFTLSAEADGHKADTSIILDIEHDTSEEPNPDKQIEFSKRLYTGKIELNKAGEWIVTFDDNLLIKITSGHTEVIMAIEPLDDRFQVIEVNNSTYEIIVIEDAFDETENTISFILEATGIDSEGKESRGYTAVSLKIIKNVKPITEISFEDYQIAHVINEDDDSHWVVQLTATSTNSKENIIYRIKDKNCIEEIEVDKNGLVIVKKKDVGIYECIIIGQGSESKAEAEAPLVFIIQKVEEKLLEFTQPSYVGKIKPDKTIVFQDGNPVLINWKEEPMFDLGPHSYYFRVKWDDGKITMESTGQTIDENFPVVTFTLSATSAGIQADTIIVLKIEHNDNEQPNPAEQIEFSQITYEGIIKRSKEGEWIVILNNGPINIISGQTCITVAINPSDERFTLKTVTRDKEYELVVNEDNFDDAVNVASVVIIATSTDSEGNRNKGFVAVSLEIIKNIHPTTEINFNKYSIAHTRKADDTTELVIPLKASSTNSKDTILYSIKDDNCISDVRVDAIGQVTVKSHEIGTHECVITATGSESQKTANATLVLVILKVETTPTPKPADYSHVVVSLLEDQTDQSVLKMEDSEYGYCVERYTPEIPDQKDLFYSQNGEIRCKTLLREEGLLLEMKVPQFTVTVQVQKVKNKKCPPSTTSSLTRSKRDISSIYAWENIAMETSRILTDPKKTTITVIVEDVNNNTPEWDDMETFRIVGYPEKDLLQFVRPPVLTKLHATDLDSIERGFGKVIYRTDSDMLEVNPETGEVYPTSAMYNDETHIYTVQACDSDPSHCIDKKLEVIWLKKENMAVMMVKKRIDELENMLRELSTNNISLRLLSVSSIYENVQAKTINIHKHEKKNTEKSVTAIIYALNAMNKPLATKDIQALFNDIEDVEVKEVVVITNPPGTFDDCDNEGFVAAVSVLTVLLIGVLIGGAFLYRKLRKQSLSNHLSETGSIETRQEAARLPEFGKADISHPTNFTTSTDTSTPPENTDENDIQKIEFVKKRTRDALVPNKFERRATGYPLNPPIVNEIVAISEDQLKTDKSSNNDIKDSSIDARSKSVKFNEKIVRSELFENTHESD